jgi:hypothetical protein
VAYREHAALEEHPYLVRRPLFLRKRDPDAEPVIE